MSDIEEIFTSWLDDNSDTVLGGINIESLVDQQITTAVEEAVDEDEVKKEWKKKLRELMDEWLDIHEGLPNQVNRHNNELKCILEWRDTFVSEHSLGRQIDCEALNGMKEAIAAIRGDHAVLRERFNQFEECMNGTCTDYELRITKLKAELADAHNRIDACSRWNGNVSDRLAQLERPWWRRWFGFKKT